MAPQVDNTLCQIGDPTCAANSQGSGALSSASLAGEQSVKAGQGVALSTTTNVPDITSTGGIASQTTSSDLNFIATTSIVQTSLTASMAVPTSPAGSGSGNSTIVQSNAGSSKTNGVSSGAVAGIAIASAIIGAALAFLAAFLLFKKRHRNQNTNGRSAKYETYADLTPELVKAPKGVDADRRESSYVQVSQTAAPLAIIPARKPVQQADSFDPLAGLLPPAADEHDVQSRVAALFGEIHRHVDAYYRNVHASITSSLEPELAQFGAKDVDIAELLQNCSSPTVALKHALVAYVLGITGPKNEGDGGTMFPKELGGVEVDGVISDPNRNIASTLHRRLSVYLYDTSSSHHSQPGNSWTVSSDTREAAEHFSLTFFPWANPADNDQERDEGLVQIMSSVLELRIWLFGQPSTYDFVWEGPGRRGVVVSPALVRRTDGRVILEMGVVSV